MPTYEFKNKETGEVTEQFMKMSEKDQFLKDNPNLEAHISNAPPFGDPVLLGIRRLNGDMKETLQRIKNANPGSDIRIR